MTDPTQFIVNVTHLQRMLTHQGVIGSGRDYLTHTPFSVSECRDSQNNKYHLQHYEAVDGDFVNKKLLSLTKAMHSRFTPSTQRICFLGTRKHPKHYQLMVYYTSISGTSLEVMLARKESFSAEVISAYVEEMIDMLHMGMTGEYLDVSPANVYLHQGHFTCSNMALESSKIYARREEKKQGSVKDAMMVVGMVAMEMATGMDGSDLYEGGSLNEKLLRKRIEGMSVVHSPGLVSVIRALVAEEKTRISTEKYYQNQEWMKGRNAKYVQSQANYCQFKNFQGVVGEEYRKGEALDQNLFLYRGTFKKGVIEGEGIKEMKGVLLMGKFQNGKLIRGQKVYKNSHIQCGVFKDQVIQRGIRIDLTTSANPHKNSTFCGKFENGIEQNGISISIEGVLI